LLVGNAATFRRPPVLVLPVSDAVGVAVPRIAALIWAAVAPLCVDAYNAAAPVTCGVAIEVPLYEAYDDAPLLAGTVE